VWARSATNTTDAPENSNGGSSVPFAITAPSTVAMTMGLTANKPASQLVGSQIIFTASVGGTAVRPTYKWWLFDGLTWSVVQDWSTTNTFSWTPRAANSQYQLWVRAQNPTNPAQNADASMSFPIVGGGSGGVNGKK
jgi:N-acetylmuramoyl-L-alanine amidase